MERKINKKYQKCTVMRATEPERWSHAWRPKWLYAPTECIGLGAEQRALSLGKGVDSRQSALKEVDGSGLPRVVGN